MAKIIVLFVLQQEYLEKVSYLCATMQHFHHLSDLLRREREEDLREFLRQVRESPLHERVEKGYSWHPLQVVQTGFALGDKAFVIVERTTKLNEPHQLRAGQMVNLFTTQEHAKHPEQTGIINFVERNRMKIILHAQDVPDWLGLGQLGVDQLFDDRSYQEMERALQTVLKAKGNRLAELRDVLTGVRDPTPNPSPGGEGGYSRAYTEMGSWLETENTAALRPDENERLADTPTLETTLTFPQAAGKYPEKSITVAPLPPGGGAGGGANAYAGMGGWLETENTAALRPDENERLANTPTYETTLPFTQAPGKHPEKSSAVALNPISVDSNGQTYTSTKPETTVPFPQAAGKHPEKSSAVATLPSGGGAGGGVLNPSQRLAIAHIQSAKEVAIVHGPPGTGKTTTLVAAIQKLTERESTVLVTAPSNTAADLLTERLAAAGVQVVRVGNISRVDEHILPHTLEATLARHPDSKNIKKVKIQAAEYRRQAKRFRRTFNAEDRRERDHLWSQARDLEAWANDLETRLLDQILSSAQAITCTLVGAAHPVLERYRFHTCIIDEAAQALEPACWIPIAKCARVILAGDPFQLPPTVKSMEAAKGGLSQTLIERCLGLLPTHVHLLDVQYRMHRAIMDFSNQYFYGGALKAHVSVGDRRLLSLDASGETVTFFDPVAFVDTAGCGFEEQVQKKQGKDSARHQSRYNPEEALLVREHLLKLIDQFPGLEKPSIGILSPYREQVNHLEAMIREDADLSALLLAKHHAVPTQPSLTINTIDGFQGQERDIIYLSLVRSNNKNEIGFLSDYRRMNVAMTRARMLLVVIGDSETIGKNPFYQAFLDYCDKKGKYQTAWEYMR